MAPEGVIRGARVGRHADFPCAEHAGGWLPRFRCTTGLGNARPNRFTGPVESGLWTNCCYAIRGSSGTDPILWEHGRRKMALEQHGALAIVLPVGGDELAGVGIFDASPEEVTEIMKGDPGIQAGIFTYELHPARGFPSSALP